METTIANYDATAEADAAAFRRDLTSLVRSAQLLLTRTAAAAERHGRTAFLAAFGDQTAAAVEDYTRLRAFVGAFGRTDLAELPEE